MKQAVLPLGELDVDLSESLATERRNPLRLILELVQGDSYFTEITRERIRLIAQSTLDALPPT